jgi:hypothetical protein
VDPALGDARGSSTEAIPAGERDSGVIGKEDAMTPISDITQKWPDAIVDTGAIRRSDHYWGIVGLIPDDGHVVLAVSQTPPNSTAPPS